MKRILPPEQPEDQGKNQADHDGGRDRQIKTIIFSFDDNITGKTTEMHLLDQGPADTDDDEQQTDENQIFGHDIKNAASPP